VLISPPPINIPDPAPELGFSLPSEKESKGADPRNDRGFRTYLSKKRFAERVMEIADSYSASGRVVGLDFWKACVDGGLEEQGRGAEVEGAEKGERYEDTRLPGCGMKSAKQFTEGWFTDGLHLGPTVSCGS
jgi:hypothetical protein